MAIYTQKTSKGQLMSASVVRLASGQFKVEIRGIEPFYEADNTFGFEAAAVKHAQAMLDEYAWRLEERYELDAIRVAEMAAFEDVQPTDEPAAVDMGGDIEALAEAVNAQPEISALRAKFEQATEYAMNEWGHMPLTFAEFCEVECEEFENVRAAIYEGEIDLPEARQMIQQETPRIKQLRARIASQERELIDLRFELSQLVGDAWQIDGKHHYAYFDGKDWIVMLRRPFSSSDAVMGNCTTRAYAEVEVNRLDAEREREEIDTAAKVRSFLRQRGTE